VSLTTKETRCPTTLPVSVPGNVGDPYVISEGGNVALSTGGTRMFGAPGDDDKVSSAVPLPLLSHSSALVLRA